MKSKELSDLTILKSYFKTFFTRPLFLLKYFPNAVSYLFLFAFLASLMINPIASILTGAAFLISTIVNSLFMVFFADGQYKAELGVCEKG